MNPAKRRLVLKETLWVLLGLLPAIAFLISELYSNYSNNVNRSIFSSDGLQLHDRYYVVNIWLTVLFISSLSIAFIYSIRFFINKGRNQRINLMTLIFLLVADYLLYRFYSYSQLLIEQGFNNQFAVFTYLLGTALSLTLLVMIAIGWRWKKNSEKI